jgi:hypothetical protein
MGSDVVAAVAANRGDQLCREIDYPARTVALRPALGQRAAAQALGAIEAPCGHRLRETGCESCARLPGGTGAVLSASRCALAGLARFPSEAGRGGGGQQHLPGGVRV